MQRLLIDERYLNYRLQVWSYSNEKIWFYYRILDKGAWENSNEINNLIRISHADFNYPSDCRMAAIGHISLIEKGED